MPGLENHSLPSHLGHYPIQYDNANLPSFLEKEKVAVPSLGFFECTRCHRSFASRSAREQHWEASGLHYICLASSADGRRCTFDGDDVEELLEHYLVIHGLHSCRGCLQVFVDLQVYMNHLDQEFACLECHRHHDSDNSVEQHMITHQRRDVGCWACDKAFTSISAMMLHLEAGCPSGINYLDVNQHAASFLPSWEFVDPAYRQGLMQRVELAQEYTEKATPFTCPDVACRANFTTMSGLFQHVENGKCRATLAEGILARLMEWLAHKLPHMRYN